MITENVSTLKIHKLTQAQYDRELAAGNIDENALYLTPDEPTDLSGYATTDQINALQSEVDGKQDKLIFDATPTADSENPVTSGGVAKAIGDSTADWSQNDATAADYVKNRTHWTDEPVEVTVLEEQDFDITLDSFPNDGENIIYMWSGETSYNFVAGQTYIVNFNRAAYECVALSDEYYTYIGSRSIIETGTTDNTEPFVFRYSEGWLEMYTVTSGIYTVSINELQVAYHTIDERYIPDTIARDSAKQDVLAGKIGQYVGFDVDNKATAVTPSWNDLVDRPFEQHIITWDGNASDKVSVVYADNSSFTSTYIKVSDVILTSSQILGVTLNNGGFSNWEGNINEFENGFSYGTGTIGAFCCVYKDNVALTLRNTTMIFPEAGFYVCDYTDSHVSGYVSEVQYFEHVFDEKYIPDTIARTSELNSKQDVLTFDTTPTEGSFNPITSGGVYTALDNKANATHASQHAAGGADPITPVNIGAYSLVRGIAITDNADLDDYTTPGSYICMTTATANTVLNTPISPMGTGFSLQVEMVSGSVNPYLHQTLRVNNATADIYKRSYRHGSGWGEWTQLATVDYVDALTPADIGALASRACSVGSTSSLNAAGWYKVGEMGTSATYITYKVILSVTGWGTVNSAVPHAGLLEIYLKTGATAGTVTGGYCRWVAKSSNLSSEDFIIDASESGKATLYVKIGNTYTGYKFTVLSERATHDITKIVLTPNSGTSDQVVVNADAVATYTSKFELSVTPGGAAPEKSRVRNIQAGTTDLTPGTSELTTGDIYLVYE